MGQLSGNGAAAYILKGYSMPVGCLPTRRFIVKKGSLRNTVPTN
jgi:hypothetical protein